MFKKVTLFTQFGELVTEVRILNFNPDPDVLIWGQRLFSRRADGRYMEAFTSTALTDEELRAMGIPPENLEKAVQE